MKDRGQVVLKARPIEERGAGKEAGVAMGDGKSVCSEKEVLCAVESLV